MNSLLDHSHRRKGKVARLPKTIRDQINALILDGLTYSQILSRLGEAVAGTRGLPHQFKVIKESKYIFPNANEPGVNAFQPRSKKFKDVQSKKSTTLLPSISADEPR